MINEQREKTDMYQILSELQKIQRAFLFEVSLDITIQEREKSMDIVATAQISGKEADRFSKCFRGKWVFESIRGKSDLFSMLDDVRRTMICAKDIRRQNTNQVVA